MRIESVATGLIYRQKGKNRVREIGKMMGISKSTRYRYVGMGEEEC